MPERRPTVLLIDDGELDGVARLVEELGIQPERLVGGVERSGWCRPERLLVVSGARAIRLPHPRVEGDYQGRFTKIAIMDQESRTLRARIERMGFDAVVYNPVHPEALRLLLASALHRGREQRLHRRFPVGCEVRWRAGLRRRRATLTELSTRGCRLLVRKAKRHQSLSLSLPCGLAGGQELKVPGRVVRYERRASDLISLTVVFDKLAALDQQRLGSYLQGVENGPPTLAA